MIASLLLAFGFIIAEAEAQQSNPAYVDDSPLAWELFQRAEEQIASNLGEAARTFQEVLDEFALRLIPAPPHRPSEAAAQDQFKAARTRVLRVLMEPANKQLLDRYRAIQTPEANRLLEAGEFEQLVLTRSLTEPGLEAMLRLGQAHLEFGRFASAVDQLNEALHHPDMAPSRPKGALRLAHAWFMLGLAMHHLGEPRETGIDRAVQELALLDDPRVAQRELVQELQRLGEIARLPRPGQGVSPLHRTPASDLTGLVAEEIWAVELSETLASRIDTPTAPIPGRPTGRSIVQIRDGGAAITVAPTVVADVVYINQGHTVLALDRFTGTRVWSQDYVDRPSIMLIDRVPGSDEQPMDLNLIAVQGDYLVTLTGHAQTVTRSNEGRIVCLDARTGEQRWTRRLDRLGERSRGRDADAWGMQGVPGDELEGLFPHGSPIIVDDLVLIEARRVSRQALTSAYVVALDLHTGELRWIRHIVSSGAIPRAARSFSTLTAPPADKGSAAEVFIVTSVGAVASISPRHGEVNWLSRFSVPLNPPIIEQNRRPWELGTPLVTRDRVIAIHGGERRIAVYDRGTGERLENLDAAGRSTWNSPAYLIGDERWVYAIGQEVRAFRIDELTTPQWVLAQSAFGNEEFELRGRVQLAEDGLIVPTAASVLIVDRETGQIKTRLHLDTPELAGNPVALDSQLLLAGDRSLRSFMSLHQAERMLRERIVRSPENPAPALSLAQLALRAHDFDLCLEAAELALRAMERDEQVHDAQRSRVVSVLLELDKTALTQNGEEVERLFTLLERAARTPEQRLAHYLAYGDRLVAIAEQQERSAPHFSTELLTAVGTWQSILSSPQLASQSHEEDGIIRRGWSWAADRIARLTARHGTSVYAVQAEAAMSRLRELKRARGSSKEFLSLAQEFPFTDAAVEALAVASRLLLEDGQPQQALTSLIGLGLELQDFGFEKNASKVLTLYSELCAGLGLQSRAEAMEVRTQPNGFGSLPLINRFPNEGARAIVLDGSLLPLTSENNAGAPTNRVLISDGTSITALESLSGKESDLRTVWSHPISRLGGFEQAEEFQVEIVRWSPEDLLAMVFPAQPATGAAAVMLDSHTGEERWRTASSAPGPGGGPDELLSLADDDVFIAVSRSGAVNAVDMKSGATMWKFDAGNAEANFRRIHRAQLCGGLLAVTGEATNTEGKPVYAVRVLDAITGESVLPRPMALGEPAESGGVGALWLTLTPLGQLIYGTANEIAAVNLWQGGHTWVNRTDAAEATKRAWEAGGLLLFEDQSGDLRTLDPRTGEIQRRMTIARAPGTPEEPEPQTPRIGIRPQTAGPGQIMAAEPIDGDILAHYRQRVVRYGVDGQVLGADMLPVERNFQWLLRGRTSTEADANETDDAENVLVVINAMQPVQDVVPGLGGARRTQHQYRIFLLSENARLLGDPIELPPFPEPAREASLIDGWLLLSLSSGTVAIPLGEGSPHRVGG